MLMPGYTTCNCGCTIPWAGPIHATLLVVIEDMNYKCVGGVIFLLLLIESEA